MRHLPAGSVESVLVSEGQKWSAPLSWMAACSTSSSRINTQYMYEYDNILNARASLVQADRSGENHWESLGCRPMAMCTHGGVDLNPDDRSDPAAALLWVCDTPNPPHEEHVVHLHQCSKEARGATPLALSRDLSRAWAPPARRGRMRGYRGAIIAVHCQGLYGGGKTVDRNSSRPSCLPRRRLCP